MKDGKCDKPDCVYSHKAKVVSEARAAKGGDKGKGKDDKGKGKGKTKDGKGKGKGDDRAW